MNKNRNLQFYSNNNKCVSLPQKEECEYLRINNYLSEYQTDLEKQQVLENLGIKDMVDQLYQFLNNSLSLYATIKFLDDNYVKKIDLYYPEEDDDDGFEEIPTEVIGDNSGFGWTVDDFLSLTSINPVQNRIITAALNKKADISMLDDYVSLQNLSSYLSGYQHLLQAGNGIKIDGNVISTTLDLNPFIFVDSLPTTGNPNKIYLVPKPNNPGTYTQHCYDPNQRKWIKIGDISVQSTLPSLDNYLTLAQADARYAKKGEIGTDTTSVVQLVINQVKQLLSKYVKKSEVYTPNLWEDSSTSDDINIDPSNNGGGTIIPGSNIDWSNYVNITIDMALSATSLNPVANKAIKTALDTKQDKLTTLNAGNGISISDTGVISCTLDTTVYKFVSVLPITGIEQNKIYLLPNGDQTYRQYVYNPITKKLEPIGNLDLGVDLTGYLSKSDASQLYMTKLDLSNTYLSKAEFSEYMNSLNLGVSTTNPTNVDLSAYATRQWVTELILNLSNSSDPDSPSIPTIDLSDYATKRWVQGLISDLNSGLDQETLEKINLLVQYVNSTSNYLDIMTAIAEKANLSDVYSKAYIDQYFQKKGDFIYRSEFTTTINGINDKITAFIIDETLSSVSEHAVQNKAVYAKLQEKLSKAEAAQTYVTKEELNNLTITTSPADITLKTINGNSLLGEGNISINFPVDQTLDESSTNAISSKGVYQYVQYTVNPYIDQTISQAISDSNLQNKLVAGYGIDINSSNNVISVVLDSVNPFIIVDSKPSEGQANKIYLIKEQNGYRQWVYINGDWEDYGLLDVSIDLSNYVTNLQLTTQFATQNSQLTNLINTNLNNLRSWANEIFLKKEDVYTPDQLDSISSDIDTNNSGSGSGSGSGSILPPDSSGTTGSAYYITSLNDGVKTNATVGNINAGTDVSTLRGLSFSEILTRMLFRESYNNPNYSHNISIDTTQTVVKVGDIMETPTVTAEWNINILPQQNITNALFVKINGGESLTFQPGSSYSVPGNYVFILSYSYPQGTYTVTSNFGNTREITAQAGQGTLTKTVRATYPWYINDAEQLVLVPIAQSHTQEVFLSGSPKISIPGANSTCTIQADLGFGYMDAAWNKTTETRNGVTYSVWTKPDSYSQEVKHKITFNIYLQ